MAVFRKELYVTYFIKMMIILHFFSEIKVFLFLFLFLFVFTSSLRGGSIKSINLILILIQCRKFVSYTCLTFVRVYIHVCAYANSYCIYNVLISIVCPQNFMYAHVCDNIHLTKSSLFLKFFQHYWHLFYIVFMT